ncbi:Aspartate ornithine carbamoyltransferase [Echinococcus multilocularis]|uniref:Aspartate ornithine carbamoyltransferase n=1 Tax=Echinococcus multilocularis TaxID=6211 RepID=A0A087VYD9_ECHMU|nr:Aspartate ornithine carbamoyltransferase [Echinococcus multilocularis]
MRAGETFVVSLNDSLNMSSTLSQVEAEKNAVKSKGRNLKPQRGRRKLRSRRNLVDSADATNNATFEISVAPLIDTRNEKESVSEVTSRGANRRAIKKLRSRRNLVDSLSAAAANITFELSVAQLSERKNEALAAASTEEASSMGALKCTAESPPLDSGAVAGALEGTEAEDEAEGLGAALSHEESPNLTKNQDSYKGGRRSSLSQSMAENFVHVEKDDAAMEISVAPLLAGLNEGQIEDTVVSTPSPEPSPVGGASMAISMSEVSGASVTVAAIQAPGIMPSVCAIPTDFSNMEGFAAAEVPPNSAVSRNEQENGDVTRHPVEHRPEALLLCEDVSMVVSNLEVSVTDEPNPPPALKEIDDEVASMIVKSSISGVGADTQFIEDEPTEEKVISMVVSQMDVSASVVDSVVAMAPKRKVTYAGRWATNNVDSRFHFTAYDAHFVDSMLRIDFAKDSTRTREVAPHDRVLPTAGLLFEPETNVQIIEAQDPRAFRADCADAADSSVMVSRPEAPATDERSSLGEVNAGNTCPEEAADVRSQVGAPTDSNCPHPAAESELSDTGVGGDGEVEVASLAISKSIAPDVVVVGQAAEFAPAPEAVANVSSQTQPEDANLLEEKLQNQPKVQGGAVPDTNFTGSRSSSDSPGDKGVLRSRRLLVNSVDAVNDNVTMDISVASLADKRSVEGREGEGDNTTAHETEPSRVEEAVTDASGQTEVEDMAVDEQAAKSTPAAEDVANVPSETQTKDASLLQEQSVNQSKVQGISTESKNSSDSPGDKGVLRSRCMWVDSVAVVNDSATVATTVASLADKGNDERREGKGDNASAHESEPSRVEEAVVYASSQAEVEDVVVVGQATESAPTAGEMAHVSSQIQAEGVSVASRRSSASRVKKRSLRSRRMLVDSVDAVKHNVTVEISVASLEGKESDGQRQREGNGASAREAEPPRVEEVVADASSQTEVVKDSSKRCRISSDSRIGGINLPRFSHHSVAETPSTKVTTNASNQTDTPAPDIEMTGQADSGKVNFKRASRPVYSRKVRKILLDESVLETPQPVSPRCVWPSPLRRSGSLGYTCPSLSAVPLVETKSKNTFSSSRVSRPTGASSGTFRSLAGSQRRTITHQEIREIEEKLLDTSADVVEDQPNPQITTSNGTTLTREKESAKSAPPVTVPNDLSLSASCLDRTILQDIVLMPPPLPPLPLKHRHGAFTGETGAVVAATAASPSFSAPTSSVATGRRRSVQFAPLAEVLRQSPHGQWSRLSVGLTDQLDLSPIPKSREGVDEVDSSTDDSGDSSDLSCSPVEENDEAELRDTVSPIPNALNRSNVFCHLSPTAVEVLNCWREDQSILVEAEEEKITEKTYIESLLPGGESLTPEQMKHVLGCLQPSEPSPDATPCSSHPNVRSKLNEKTCEIDPSITSLSQWLPPPSEGKVYDMDAVGNALRLMLMGWVEPQDPVFIPLPKSAYQHHVNAGPGLRRSTRIRVAPPRDSYERVYYDVRPNPTTGRLERIPLGYLRYPNQKEVRRRQQLLKNRLQVDDKDTAAVRKRARDARLHRLAAKRRRVLGLSDASHHFGRSRVIVLESDVTWVKDGTNSLPIGQLINSMGPSNLPVVFDSLNEAQSHLKGGVIQSLTECEIEPGSGLSHVGPFEQSLHDITNVISAEQKRRGLHFDAKASNLFTLRLQNPDELTSKNPLLAVQIGTYAIPLRKACCVLVPKGIPYKFISIASNVIRLSRLRFIPPQ